MNTDRLRFDLADLAEDVTPVDLRDRALRTSRRLGIRQAVSTSAVALLLLGAAAGTAFAIRPDARGPDRLPGDSPSITFIPSPDDVSPSTAPSTEPAVLAGTRYYLNLTAENAVIHAVRGDTTDVVASIALRNDRCVGNSITVSPDGRRVAWVGNGDSSGVGTLLTAAINFDGSRGANPASHPPFLWTEIQSGVNCLGSTSLVWQGGNRLMVQKRDGTSVLMGINVTGGGGQPIEGDPGQETDRRWSADGRYLAAVTETGQPFVAGPGVSRLYRYSPPADEAGKYDGWSARSVSMDGRYVSVGWKGTDPSRRDDSFAVVDTTTGKLVNLPVHGEIRSIHFTADRRVLVRQADRIVVLDSQFDVLGEVAEPRELRELTLLACVP